MLLLLLPPELQLLSSEPMLSRCAATATPCHRCKSRMLVCVCMLCTEGCMYKGICKDLCDRWQIFQTGLCIRGGKQASRYWRKVGALGRIPLIGWRIEDGWRKSRSTRKGQASRWMLEESRSTIGRIPLTAPGSNPVITPENGLSLSLSHTRSQNHAHT